MFLIMFYITSLWIDNIFVAAAPALYCGPNASVTKGHIKPLNEDLPVEIPPESYQWLASSGNYR